MNPGERKGASPRFFSRLQTTATSATVSPAAIALPLTKPVASAIPLTKPADIALPLTIRGCNNE